MEIMQAKGSLHKAVKVVAALSGVAVGVNSFLNISTAAYYGGIAQAGQQSFKNRIVIATSLVAGPGVAGPLAQATGVTFTGNLPSPNFTPLKILNPTTITGAVMLGADHFVLRGLGIPGYSQWLRPFVISIGMGALIGGALGGLFDPPTNAGAVGSGAGRIAYPMARTPGFAGAASLAGGSSSFGFNSGRAGSV